MAQETLDRQQWIDDLLDQLTATWEKVPEVAAKIDGWDIGEQLTYTEEWPLYNDMLYRLGQYVEHGQLTPAQRQRYAALLELIERNRPLRDQVLR